MTHPILSGLIALDRDFRGDDSTVDATLRAVAGGYATKGGGLMYSTTDVRQGRRRADGLQQIANDILRCRVVVSEVLPVRGHDVELVLRAECKHDSLCAQQRSYDIHTRLGAP
jgi:hypothetical protein